MLAFSALALSLAQANPQAALGQQAYFFAYPLVLMDQTKSARGGGRMGLNRFLHLQTFPEAGPRAVVRPNADTLYSQAWLDLSKEPVIMRLPEMKGRYYLMQVLDAWTETIAVPGKRTTGTGEGWFAICGPEFSGKLPAKVTHRIDSATNLVWLLGRIQTNGPSDYANVRALQREFRVMPLSRYPDGNSSGVLPAQDPLPAVGTPPIEVAKLSNLEFFNRFLKLLASNRGHTADAPFLKQLEDAGFKPGRRLSALPGGGDFEAGVEAAKKLLATVEQLRATTAGGSGWSKPNPVMGRYGTNYQARAVVARVGLGANPPEDAVYLNCYKDMHGRPLDSGRAYVMHFGPKDLPPVEAFWSLTMYSPQGYFVENPIRRYAIGDRDPLRFNADGSLDLYVQRDPPVEVRNQANWLPAPAHGPFNLMLRFYWPRPEIMDGSWTPPPVEPAAP